MENIKEIKSTKYLIRITIPVFIETLFAMLVGQADQFMISSKTDTGFAALGNANQVINFLILFLRVVSMASTILIAQYIGANERSKLNKIYSLSVYFNVALSAIIGFVLVVFGKSIHLALECPSEILNDCVTYTKIIACGLVFEALLGVYGAFYKSNGYMKECMYVIVIVNLLNIFGNFVFLYGLFGLPELGVKGVAYSSVISKFIGYIIVFCLRKHFNISTSIRHLIPFPYRILFKILSVGFPAMGESFAYSTAMIFVQKFVNRFGKLVVDARTAVNTVAFIAWIFSIAISTTTQIVVGYLMGAREFDSIKKRYKSSLRIAMVLSFIGSIILFIFGRFLCSIFIDSKEALDLCQKILFVDIFLEQGRAVNLVTVRTLQACGDTKFPIFIGIIDTWIVAVLGGFVLSIVFNLGIIGIWIALASDEIFRGIIYIIRFKSGKWKTFNLID